MTDSSRQWPGIVGLRDEAELRAEVVRLRDALRRSENDWAFLFNLHPDVELEPNVRMALAEANLKVVREALGGHGSAVERRAGWGSPAVLVCLACGRTIDLHTGGSAASQA